MIPKRCQNDPKVAPHRPKNGPKSPYIASDRVKNGSKKGQKVAKSGQKRFKSHLDLHQIA